MAGTPTQCPLFAPYTVDLRKDLLSAKEDLLWDLTSSLTPKDVAPKLCAQLRVPCSEENCKELEHQIERTLRNFRDSASGAPVVAIVLQVPLGGDLVLVDKVTWDLGNPRFTAEMHAAATCRDLGLGWMEFAVVAKALKAKIDAARQDVKAGRPVHVAPLPQAVKRERPAGYPTVVRIKRHKPAPGTGSTPGNTPVKADPAAISPSPSPVKAEPPVAMKADPDAQQAGEPAVGAAPEQGQQPGVPQSTAKPAVAGVALPPPEQQQQQGRAGGREESSNDGKGDGKAGAAQEGSDMPDLGFD